MAKSKLTKTQVRTNYGMIISLLVTFVMLLTLLICFTYRLRLVKFEKNILGQQPNNTVDYSKVTSWPSFSETDNWKVVANETLKIQMKYPEGKVFVHTNNSRKLSFTTADWKDLKNYPPIALTIETLGKTNLDLESIVSEQKNPYSAYLPAKINNTKGYIHVSSYPEAGYDLYLQDQNGIRTPIRILSYDDRSKDIETKKEELRLFNIMISTIEYLD